MKIKQANIVSREDLEGLARALNNSINAIVDDNTEHALYILENLRDNIDSNLAENEIDRELKVHDKVRIISTDDLELREFIGKEGWIIKIDDRWGYPYEVDFANENLSNDWLWKAEQLKLV